MPDIQNIQPMTREQCINFHCNQLAALILASEDLMKAEERERLMQWAVRLRRHLLDDSNASPFSYMPPPYLTWLTQRQTIAAWGIGVGAGFGGVLMWAINIDDGYVQDLPDNAVAIVGVFLMVVAASTLVFSCSPLNPRKIFNETLQRQLMVFHEALQECQNFILGAAREDASIVVMDRATTTYGSRVLVSSVALSSPVATFQVAGQPAEGEGLTEPLMTRVAPAGSSAD